MDRRHFIQLAAASGAISHVAFAITAPAVAASTLGEGISLISALH